MKAKEFLTAAETAKSLNMSEQTLANWRCQRSEGPKWVNFGRSIRYRRSDIDAWLADNTVDPHEDSIIDLLPKTEDGKPIAPGMKVFTDDAEERHVVSVNDGLSRTCRVFCDKWYSSLYSTREAALSAKELLK